MEKLSALSYKFNPAGRQVSLFEGIQLDNTDTHQLTFLQVTARNIASSYQSY